MWATVWLKLKDIGGKIISSKIFLWGVVLLGGYLAINGFLKKDKFEEKDLPNSGSGLPVGWGAQQAKLLATEGNEVIDGLLTLASTKEIWAAKLVALSDDQLSLVFYAYNDSYGKVKNETMTEAMANEWNHPGSSSNWRNIIDRLRGMKLY